MENKLSKVKMLTGLKVLKATELNSQMLGHNAEQGAPSRAPPRVQTDPVA
jgi:hypothetical protein